MKRNKILLVIMALFLIVLVTGCGDKHEHVYGDWEIVVAPTETTTGEAKKKCECGNEVVESIPALSDTTTWKVEVTDSTCTVKGNKKYTSKYGEIVIELPLADHEYSEWTLTLNPTETEVGEAKRTCKYGETQTVEVPNLNDTKVWTKTVIDATCTKEGLITYTSIYGTIKQAIEKLEHKYGDWEISENPTLEKDGKAYRTCSICNTKETITIPNLSDNNTWKETRVDATCSMEGKAEYKSIYGTVTLVLPKLDHKYSNYTLTVLPTEKLEGKALRECSVCHEKDEVIVPKLTDTNVWKVEIKDSTCLEKGSKTYTSVYGKVVIELELSSHDYSPWKITTYPTYKTKGIAERKCLNCGVTETKELPTLTDNTVWTVKSEVAPTYNDKGERTFTSIYGDVTVDVQKKVAPYDNKTYHTFAFDAEDNTTGGFSYGKVNVETAWNKTSITLDNNGKGDGDSHPFRGHFEIKMVDPETGKIEILNYKDNTLTELLSKVYGYVDFNTGIIVSPNNNSIHFAQVWTPFESGVTEKQANASSWNDSLAIEYTYNKKTYTIYVTDERTYFNVSYIDLDGNQIKAEDVFNSPIVYIKHNDKLLKTYVYNGKNLVESDGFEGKYTGSEGILTLSGCGNASLDNVKGTYNIAKKGSNYTIDLYINNEYFELTIKNKTYTLNKVMVNVTLNKGEFGTTETINVNKNIKLDLPVLTNETQTFKGWFLDELCLNPVEGDFIPTEDTTLYAYWVSKVIISIVGGIKGDPDTLYLGDGDTIGDFLPKYNLDLVNKKKFVGWYLDPTFETTLPEDAIVVEGDSGVKIYANWETLPLYFGSYKGCEHYGLQSGNSGTQELNIDENGNITGLKTGKIINYDNSTQTILYKEKETDTEAKKIYFDEYSLTLAIPYTSGNDLKGDYYLFIQDSVDGVANSAYAINIPNEEGKYDGFYARFLNINTPKGAMDILVMFNRIYSNISLSDSLGNPLTTKTIKSSRTIIAKDNLTNSIIFKYGTKGDNFDISNDRKNNVKLDNYYGTYTNNLDTLTLDGIDKIVYNDKIGTYKFVKENTFDVYLDNNNEYYELVLNGKSFTITKVMVNITFVVGNNHNPINPVKVNKNVLMTLPDVTEEGYVFNGWFLDQQFEVSAIGFVPTKDTTLYAKFSYPAILTIVYNNGQLNDTITYSVGDIVEIANPTYKKFAFAGWYTTIDYKVGSEYTMGNKITTDLTIYAKWVEAPLYNNSFGAVEISETKLNGKSRISNQGFPSFDENGLIVKTGYYPFNQGTQFVDYNKTEKTAKFLKNNKYYSTFMNDDGLIVISQENSNNMDEIWLLAPGETEVFTNRVSSSYFMNGMARLVSYIDLNNITHNIFVYNNNCYFDVKFADLLGNEITDINNAYLNKDGLRVFDSSSKMIEEFGFNGTTLTTLDGKQGTYTEGEVNTVILDGTCNITLNGEKGTYTLVTDESYTLNAVVNNTYYEITLVNDTCTVVKPMVEITFDLVGGTIEGGLSQQFNINILQKLPVPEKENYAFKGWLDGDVILPELYTPTTNKHLVATWAEAYYVTFIMNNGAPTEEFPIEKNTSVDMIPNFEDHIFIGWFLDSTLTKPYENTKITAPTTLFAKWMDMPTYFGTYYGAEFDDGHVFDNKLLTITPDFKFTSTRYNGTLIPESYNELTHTINFIDNYNSRFNIVYYEKFGEEEYFILNFQKSSYDPISDDFMVYLKHEKPTEVKSYTWNNNNNRIGFMYYNDTVRMFYTDIITNDFYGEISIEDNLGTSLTFDTLKTTKSLVIKDYNGNIVKQFAKENEDFILLDGNQGIYKGPLDTLTIDGIKSFTIGLNNELNGTYKVINDYKLKLTFSDRHIVMIEVNPKTNTYKLVSDETTGTYTCDNDVFVSNGDGTCTYNGTKATYIYDGYNLFYTIGDNTELIQLKSDGTFIKKSNKPAVSGYEFVGQILVDDWTNPGYQVAYTVKISFQDSKQIIGNIQIFPTYEMGETSIYEFTGVLEEYLLTLTITSSKYNGKTLVCTIENGSLTINESGISEYNLKGLKLVNDKFVLPSLMHLVLGRSFVGEVKDFDPDRFEEVRGPITITFSDEEPLVGTLKIHLWNSPDDTKITGSVKGPNLEIMTEDGQIIEAIISDNTITIPKGMVFFYGYETINYSLDNVILITE